MVSLILGIPYAARLAAPCLLEVDPGLLQHAVVAMGARPQQTMFKVYIAEALPGLIRAFTVLSITMINFSAVAGAVGGGGLGNLAIRYGYQRFGVDVLAMTLVVLIVLVQGAPDL